MTEQRLYVGLATGWRMTADPGNEGLAKKWFEHPPQTEQPVQPIAGAPIWCFCDFDLPTPGRGHQAELRLEDISGEVDIWLNGVRIAEEPHAALIITRVVTAHLHAGRNLLVIRRRDSARPPVALLRFLPKIHLESILIQPDLRRKRVVLRVQAAGGDLVRAQVEGQQASVEGPPGNLVLEVPHLDAWSPEAPGAQHLRVTLLQAGEVKDELLAPFGLREFTVKDEEFHLNHRPKYVRAVQWTIAPGTDPATAYAAAREAGFNALSVAVSELPALQDSATAAGMLLIARLRLDLAQNQPAQELQEQMASLLSPYWNSPALLMWQIDLQADGAVLQEQAWADVLHQTDPTRVWMLRLSDGGGTRTFLLRPFQQEVRSCDAYAFSQRAPVGALSEYYFRQAGVAGSLLFLEGMRSPAVAVEAVDTLTTSEAFMNGFSERQLDRVFTDAAGFATATCNLQADALRFQIDALRSNNRISGYCACSLADAKDSIDGIATAALQPKPALAALSKVHLPVRPLIHMQRKNLATREEVSVTVLLANEARLEGRGELSLQVVGPTNQVLWKKKRGVKIPRDGKELWEGSIGASGSPGLHRFVVRLIHEGRVVGEGSLEFLVLEAAVPTEVPIHVTDPRGEWAPACRALATIDPRRAQVFLLPPIANTIRAYPENDLLHLLAQVEGGAVAIVFGPPEDWNDLAEQVDPVIRATSRDALGLDGAAFHYVKLHPVFEGLPARGLMRQPYRNVAPPAAFVEPTDEDISGVYVREQDSWWGSNFLVRRYGSGRIVFTHLRVLENLGFDPFADKLFANMLNHFARRSVPSEGPLPLNLRAQEWLRQERQRTRRWMICGDFPNWRGSDGHEKSFPPEQGVQLDAEYVGWYRIIRWRPWFCVGADPHDIDLHAVLRREHPDRAAAMPSTAYAYAELTSDKRQEVLLTLDSSNAVKCWVNGTLVGGGGYGERREAKPLNAVFKQGKNTLLVKCSSVGGAFGFRFAIEPGGREPLVVNWWK